MLPIDHKICSFTSTGCLIGDMAVTDMPSMEYFSVSEIRADNGYPVSSFGQLVALTGLVGLRNRKYDLYFRGQNADHKDSNSRSTIYPSICRPGHENAPDRIYTSVIAERYEMLQRFTAFFKKKQYHARLDEYYYALAQHYELMPTPLIDITQSLRVAATFALRNSETGYMYVMGLPYPQGSISHFMDQDMVLVKLQNVCPANALRPRYQEGFLTGRLPFTPCKEAGDNIANRLLAKFKLDNTAKQFWNEHFKPLPDELLFPPDDIYLSWLRRMYAVFCVV